MRRLLLALISFSLAAVLAMPVPAMALPSNAQGNPGAAGELVVTWDQSGDGTVVDYVIDLDQGAAVVATNTVAQAGPLTTTFTGLGNGEPYNITVTARDAGTATVGTPATATGTTAVIAPSGATVSLGSVTTNSMVATFSADAGGGTNTYTVTVRENNATGAFVQAPTVMTSPATFSSLNPNQTYFVLVSASNGVAPASTANATATTSAPPIVAPSNVVVTIGTETETAVPVSWTSDGDPATYTVSISPNDGAGAGALTGSTATSTTFTGLNPGTNYVVTVSATNGGGTSGGVGNATTEIADPVIGTFTATADGSTAIDLAWSATSGGGTNAYTTTISPNEGTGGVSGSAATSARYTGLTPGQSYTITLTATNAGGTDTDTASATTSAVAASAPPSVSAALGGAFGNFVTVGWTAPTNNGGSPITGYLVTLSNNVSITVNNAAARSTTFETLAAGTTVTATVRAITAAGNGASSAATNPVTTSNVPGAVTSLSAAWAGASNINSIDVSWAAPGATGGLAITGYVVSVTPALGNSIPVVAPGQTSLVIGGLEQGTSYTVTVRAQNARGNSVAATSGAVLVPSTPGTVTDLLVRQSPPFSSGVVLTWALPLQDGGSPITGYSIVVDGRAPLVVGPTVTTASFGDLAVGVHSISIRAITAAGFGATVTSPNFEVKAFAPFDTEEEFVTQLYTDFLRRSPDAGGLAFWTQRVANDGSNVQDIVEAFMRSPEFAPRRSVARLYFAYFNRQPDKGGFDFWTRQISSGAANLENTSQAFALSPEFVATYGSLNDAEFIVLVYNNVLGRRPDQGGFEFWLDRLTDGLPRGSMMTAFSESPENILRSRPAVDVTVTYDGLLQREADVEGFRFWTGRVSGENTGLTELIRQFYFSLEYADRVNR